ncbi:MAG: laminin G domain-containing protein, partial [Candidatus Omnitrophica bacterium]|nr:laminin G domain-containing protein [Candidatus Omnitrophota bacterium]
MTIPQEGNAATVNGTASFTAGVRGSAITFDAAGEYATVPSAGNINASAGTLEMWVKSNVEGNPSVDEQLFFGDAAFNIFFDSDGRINFEISSGVHLTDAADTYDGLWHHVRAMWNYANGQYLLYVDGVQVASSLAVYAMPTIDDVMMYLGAVDAADTNRYNGLIDGFLIYDAMILPYGAYNVPAAWGDAAGKTDSTVLLYWDADSATLNVGTGSATLGGSITADSAINGSGLVNDSAGEYASFVSTGNIINSEGSLGFWVKSDVTGNPSGVEYLLYAGTDFNVFFDALGFVNFNISSGVNLQHALDIYDARWHFVRCTWNYDDDLYELFVDGVRSASTTNAYTAPALDAVAYVTALNNSGTNRFDGSLDELYVTDSASTPVTATAYGQPVMQPQAAAPYSYRVDVGSNLDGLASGDRLTPLSDFTVSATNSPSEYILEYLGNIATTGSPSISATSATQNANATTVTISYTGTDPDNDTVTYTAVDCEYSLDSTDGANGTWNDMTTTSGTTESFTSAGVSLSYVWNAASDTNVYDGIVYLRLTVKDGIGHASKAVSIAPIAVDTLAPSGLGNFNINGTATTMITV